jgi:hypothetical protein
MLRRQRMFAGFNRLLSVSLGIDVQGQQNASQPSGGFQRE